MTDQRSPRTRVATLPGRLALLALAALVGALALLFAPPDAMSSPQASARATVRVGSSAYGPMLFDGRGFALYAFTRDPRGRSACSGACADAWPPYTTTAPLGAGAGARRSLLALTRRADGSMQVTYAGRPLYYYVNERRPGQVLCQNVFGFGGLWLVVRGSGRLVR